MSASGTDGPCAVCGEEIVGLRRYGGDAWQPGPDYERVWVHSAQKRHDHAAAPVSAPRDAKEAPMLR